MTQDEQRGVESPDPNEANSRQDRYSAEHQVSRIHEGCGLVVPVVDGGDDLTVGAVKCSHKSCG